MLKSRVTYSLARIMLSLVILAVFLITSRAYADAPNDAVRPVLKLNQDGHFRILMINDTQDTHKTLKDTLLLVEKSLDKLKPDLVVLVGDNVAAYWLGVDEKKVAKAIDNIVGPINDRQIPFAVVFGNHDSQTGVSKEKQMAIYRSYPYCLAVDEGDALPNCGTYNLLIKDSAGQKSIFNIWMIDAGVYAADGHYGSVHPDQIKWYVETSNALKAQNNGKPLPSLLFQHIPVPQIYDLLSAVPEGTEGAVKHEGKSYLLNTAIAAGRFFEGPCPPDEDTGEFAAWVQQGDILGAYFGHDHVNDFMGTLQGIDLGYSPGSGFYQYGPGVYRGVRTFDLDESNLGDYETKVWYYKDLVAEKAGTDRFDEVFISQLRIAVPVFLAAVILFLLLALLAMTIVEKTRTRKT